MAVIREENDKIVKVMGEISMHVIDRLGDTAIGGYIRRKGLGLTEAILNDMYKVKVNNALSNNKGQEVKGFINPHPNSWLNLIDYDRVRLGNETFNKGFVNYDEETLNSLTKRVEKEVGFYKESAVNEVKRYVYKVNDFIKNSGDDSELPEILVNSIELTELYDLLRNKGWLNAVSLHNQPPMTTAISTTFKPDALANITTDLEIGILAKDELSKDNEVNSYIATALSSLTLGGFASFVSGTTIVDLNGLIGLNAILSDAANKLTAGTAEYDLVVTMVNVTISTISALANMYNSAVAQDRIVVSYERSTTDAVTMNVIKSVYDEYMKTGGSLAVILGAVYQNTTSPLNVGRLVQTGFYVEDLQLNKIKYADYAEMVKGARLLTNKNNTAMRLRNYYVYALDNALGEAKARPSYKAVRDLVNSKSVGELMDINKLAFFIFENIVYKDNNFGEFMTGYREAEAVITKDGNPEMLAQYATMRLILKYLSNQTYIS